MKYVWALLAILIIYSGYEAIRVTSLIRVGTKLAGEARPFERAEGTGSLLVLGDSTAVGVGSPSEETVAARLGFALSASVENRAKSGAATGDIVQQLASAGRERYDIILIQVGANDVIRFHSITETAARLNSVLEEAAKKSDHVVLLTGGKIGTAPFFPPTLGWLWIRQSAKLRTEFMSSAQEQGALYVDIFSAQEPFNSDSRRYYAPDGLHLTGDGYGFWYEEVVKALQNRWPGLLHGSN